MQPYIKDLALPPPIKGKTHLHKRMTELEQYLSKLILTLIDRMPYQLLTFLNFNSFKPSHDLKKISEINLKLATVIINSSDVVVNNKGAAKLTFSIDLAYMGYENVQVVNTVHKVYNDFKCLYDVLIKSDIMSSVPELPPKNADKSKKTTDALQSKL